MSVGTCQQCGTPGRVIVATVSHRGNDPRNLCCICEIMLTISEVSSRVHDDHDIRNVELLTNLLTAATNYWVLPADTLQANEPHQPGPPTLSPDLRAHPLHQMPRTLQLSATYYACEGSHHAHNYSSPRGSGHHHYSSVGPLLGETSPRFPTTFLVTPDRSLLTVQPFPQQTPPPGTQCTAYALQGYLAIKCPYGATHTCLACQYPVCEGHTTQCARCDMQPLCHHCSTPRPGHASFMCDPLRNANEESRTTMAFAETWPTINASTWDPHQLRSYALARLHSNHPASTLPQGDTLQQQAPSQPLPATTLAQPHFQPPNFSRSPSAQPPNVYDTATQHYLQFQPDGTATSDSRHPPSQQGLPFPPFTYSPPPTLAPLRLVRGSGLP